MPLRATIGLADAREIEAALEGLVRVNVQQMKRMVRVPSLREAGVRYQRERAEHWQTARELLRTRRGDCEDLVAYLVAQWRKNGDTGARPRVLRTQPRVWHVVAVTGRGRVIDPSRALGMGRGRA